METSAKVKDGGRQIQSGSVQLKRPDYISLNELTRDNVNAMINRMIDNAGSRGRIYRKR